MTQMVIYERLKLNLPTFQH